MNRQIKKRGKGDDVQGTLDYTRTLEIQMISLSLMAYKHTTNTSKKVHIAMSVDTNKSYVITTTKLKLKSKETKERKKEGEELNFVIIEPHRTSSVSCAAVNFFLHMN